MKTKPLGRSSNVLHLISIITVFVPALPGAECAEPIRLKPGVHQLFLDDVMVSNRINVTSTMHPPRKFNGNPVLLPKPGVEDGALLYGTVLRDGSGLFKMWYTTGRVGTKTPWALAYATSVNGIHWKKPNLDVMPELKNPANIVVAHPHIKNYGEPFSVILDRRDPDPKRRYKLVYRYLTPLPEMKALGTTTAVSPDGIHWTPAGSVRVPKILDVGHFLFDELKNKYAVYGRLYDGRRKVQLSLSGNFESWSNPVLVADINKKDPPGTHLYSMGVFIDGGQYLGLTQLYLRGTTHLLDVELSASRDGLTWNRVHQGKKFIPCGGPGEWDRFNNSICCQPVRVGDELWFYYGGRTYRHGGYGGPDRGTEDDGASRARIGGTVDKRGGPPPFQGMRSAVGLAKLRVDGYVSLNASFDGGSVTTVPLLLRGNTLHLNAVSRFGQIVVEILGPNGKPVPGGVSEPIRANGVDLKVRWANALPTAFSGKTPVKLRFRLRNARLYSYWIR